MAVNEASKFDIFEREKNQPIHQWVYQVLRYNILRLHLAPGQEISETDVSDRLGISRTPVREAFIRLAEDGLLEVKPQKWSCIPLIDLEQAEDARFVRRSLEKSILKEACKGLPASALTELEYNIELQKRYFEEKDFENFLNTDDEFHRSIYRRQGKERVWSFIKKLYYNYDRLRIMTLELTIERLIQEHRAILSVLVTCEGSQVDLLVDEHLTNKIFKQVILDYPEEFFKQDPQRYSQRMDKEAELSVALE